MISGAGCPGLASRVGRASFSMFRMRATFEPDLFRAAGARGECYLLTHRFRGGLMNSAPAGLEVPRIYVLG